MLEQTLAYIDPGTGSVIAQALASAALTIAFLFRKALTAPFHMLKSAFGGGRPDEPSTSTPVESGAVTEPAPDAAPDSSTQEETVEA